MSEYRYTHDIPSVYTMNPPLPSTIHGINLDQAIRAGDLILPDHLEQARALATFLGALKKLGGGPPELTDDVVFSAGLRVTKIEMAQAEAIFGPTPNIYIMDPRLPFTISGVRIDQEIRAGEVTYSDHVKRAHALAAFLGALKELGGGPPQLTDEAVFSAGLRATKLEMTQAEAIFTPATNSNPS